MAVTPPPASRSSRAVQVQVASTEGRRRGPMETLWERMRASVARSTTPKLTAQSREGRRGGSARSGGRCRSEPRTRSAPRRRRRAPRRGSTCSKPGNTSLAGSSSRGRLGVYDRLGANGVQSGSDRGHLHQPGSAPGGARGGSPGPRRAEGQRPAGAVRRKSPVTVSSREFSALTHRRGTPRGQPAGPGEVEADAHRLHHLRPQGQREACPPRPPYRGRGWWGARQGGSARLLGRHRGRPLLLP